MFETIECRACAGTGRACDKPPCGGCPQCHSTGREYAAVIHEIDVPCPLPGDRPCKNCGPNPTVYLRWTNGPAIARCCGCNAYICAMPKAAIFAALSALEALKAG
ncbi:hypothetical protein SMNI109538_10190 [Smaragdicoccus niigatensis]